MMSTTSDSLTKAEEVELYRLLNKAFNVTVRQNPDKQPVHYSAILHPKTRSLLIFTPYRKVGEALLEAVNLSHP